MSRPEDRDGLGMTPRAAAALGASMRKATPAPPPALSPSPEEIAALLEERVREFRTMHDDVPVFAGEIAVWSAAASALRSLAEEHKALIREVESWRWLHWGKTDASWACPCGNALGAGLDSCPECGTLRPRRDRPHAVRLRSLGTPTGGR